MACSPWFPTRTPQWRRRSGGPVEGSAGGLSVHLGLPPPPAGPSEAWGGAGQGRAGVGGRHAGRATGNGSVCFLGTVHGGGSQRWPRARRCPRGRPAEGSEKGWGIGCTPRSVHAAPPGWVLVVAGAGPSPESWAQGRASRGRRAASGRGLAGVGEKKGGVGTTESNFCFSVELGWAGLGGGVRFSVSKFLLPLLRNLFFSFRRFARQSCQRNQDWDCCGMFRKLLSLGPMLTNRLAGAAPVAVNAGQRPGRSRLSTRTARTP